MPATTRIHVGEAVSAQLGGTTPETAIVVISATGSTLGILAGIPELAQLIRCLQAGVVYSGSVNQFSNGAIEVVLWRR